MVDDPDKWDNFRFYMGEIPMRAMGDEDENVIDHLLSTWWGNYELLEYHHGWVQWLFPIREQGTNPLAQPLTCAERDSILKEPTCRQRAFRSYELVLDFWGLRLDEADGRTGNVVPTEACEARFQNLNRKRHNCLRITRVLKWLGEFDMQAYQAPLVRALAKVVFEPPYAVWNLRISLINYFLLVVKDDAEREALAEEVDILQRTAEKDRAAEEVVPTIVSVKSEESDWQWMLQAWAASICRPLDFRTLLKAKG
jgi:hypothetical protein